MSLINSKTAEPIELKRCDKLTLAGFKAKNHTESGYFKNQEKSSSQVILDETFRLMDCIISLSRIKVKYYA